MADPNKAWSKSDKEAFGRGATGATGVAPAPVYGADKSRKITMAPKDQEENEEIEGMQKANIAEAKTSPGTREKLNSVAGELAKWRAKGGLTK